MAKKRTKEEEKAFHREYNRMLKDVRENGFGIFDTNTKQRINPSQLVLMWDSKIKNPTLEEIKLGRDLVAVRKIYRERFKGKSAYGLALFREDPEKWAERLIRAVEICTLEYILDTGGGLNLGPQSIAFGNKRMHWE